MCDIYIYIPLPHRAHFNRYHTLYTYLYRYIYILCNVYTATTVYILLLYRSIILSDRISPLPPRRFIIAQKAYLQHTSV